MPHIYNLRLASKFMLLGCVLLVILAIPVALYFQVVLKESSAAKEMNKAGRTVVAMNHVIKSVQSLRGISTAALNGDKELAARLPMAQAAAAQQLEKLDGQLQELDIGSRLRREWSEIKTGWEKIAGMLDNETMTGAQSLDAHTRLIRQIMVANDQLLAEYGFSLESDLDVHSLIQASLVFTPKISEALGIMRAKGSAFLAQGSITPQEVGSLRTEIRFVRQLQEDIQNNLSRITEEKSQEHEELFKIVENTRARVTASLDLIERELVDANAAQYPASRYFDEISETIEQLHAFNSAAITQLTTVLAERVDDANRKVLQTTLAMLAGLSLAVAMALAIMRSITRPVNQVSFVAEAVAHGDLTVTAPVQGTNEFSSLMARIEGMRQYLLQLIAQISDSASNVASASSTMASDSEDLSTRTASQAAALEETAASMEQITVTVRANADRARQANSVSVSAADVASKSGEAIENLSNTMGKINALAKQIVEIVSVIDGIAFQTNILSLNASVEAARAGLEGRGFAVVATEVRALAQRSASAAKEIKNLIDTSVDAISEGYRLANDAGELMNETVASINHVTDIMAEIALASEEQSIGIEQINQAVSQIDQTTQRNADIVEKTFKSSRGLQQQAARLAALVCKFKIGTGTLEPDKIMQADFTHTLSRDLLRIGPTAAH